jgi:glycosyltransferase involved in cell wall biosynthesis
MPPKEIIIVDDASTDNSIEIIDSLKAKYPEIVLLRNEKNRGAVESGNLGFKHATGEFVYHLSADDVAGPEFFKRSVGLLSCHSQAGLCCSDALFYNQKNDILYIERKQLSSKPSYIEKDDLAWIMKGNYIAGHTCMYRKWAIEEAGYYLPQLKWHCDWFAVHVIAARHGICYIPDGTNIFAIEEDSYSRKGVQDWNQQKVVLANILQLLNSPEYNDVLPFFVTASLMSHFGKSIVRVVLNNPEFWTIENMMLIQHRLWEYNGVLSSFIHTRELKCRKPLEKKKEGRPTKEAASQ